MQAQQILDIVANKLNTAFAKVDPWFEEDEELMNYKPAPEAWSVQEILEHITLTSHYLMILINKGATKALQQAAGRNMAAELEQYTFDEDKLKAIGEHSAFEWNRPTHMVPTGTPTLLSIRTLMQQQHAECLQILGTLSNGEGILYKTTMTVNGLGKINVYEYIYFLAQHAQRHVTQMEKNEANLLRRPDFMD